jgi:hypothetical protein
MIPAVAIVIGITFVLTFSTLCISIVKHYYYHYYYIQQLTRPRGAVMTSTPVTAKNFCLYHWRQGQLWGPPRLQSNNWSIEDISRAQNSRKLKLTGPFDLHCRELKLALLFPSVAWNVFVCLFIYLFITLVNSLETSKTSSKENCTQHTWPFIGYIFRFSSYLAIHVWCTQKLAKTFSQSVLTLPDVNDKSDVLTAAAKANLPDFTRERECVCSSLSVVPCTLA